MNDNFPVPGCRIERITRDCPERLHVAAHGTKPNGHCPDCGRASRAVHSHYRRCPADLPLLGSQVRVGLRVRRFYCRNTACARQTFAERLPDLVAPHARRTGRLAEAQTRVGVALGGGAGSRLMCRLAMPASAATVLRLVRRPPLPETEPPRAVGVDDWAMRKGRTYGTIVVDLERRRVVDLLPDRTAETLAGWLQQRPGIAVVARDRSTEYARGIALGAPGAVQVCDRWHLLANMRQAVERWLQAAHARLRRLPMPPAGTEQATPVPVRRDRAFRRSGPERAARAASRARRRARYDEVRAGIWRGGPCSPSPVRRALPARPCANTPAPRAFQSGPPMVRAAVSSIRICPTWNGGWPKAARTAWRFGASCAPKASRAGPSRCTAGSPSGGRGRPRPGGAAADRMPPGVRGAQ